MNRGHRTHELSLGMGLATVTGWLGGELVDRLGVGVSEGAHLDAPSSLSHRSARELTASGRDSHAGNARRPFAHRQPVALCLGRHPGVRLYP